MASFKDLITEVASGSTSPAAYPQPRVKQENEAERIHIARAIRSVRTLKRVGAAHAQEGSFTYECHFLLSSSCTWTC
jgi:hypothetical protein